MKLPSYNYFLMVAAVILASHTGLVWATDVEVVARQKGSQGGNAYVLHVAPGAAIQAEDLSQLMDAAETHGRAIHGQKFGDLTVHWASGSHGSSDEAARQGGLRSIEKTSRKAPSPATRERSVEKPDTPRSVPPNQKPDLLLIEPSKPEKPDIIIVEPGTQPTHRTDSSSTGTAPSKKE